MYNSSTHKNWHNPPVGSFYFTFSCCLICLSQAIFAFTNMYFQGHECLLREFCKSNTTSLSSILKILLIGCSLLLKCDQSAHQTLLVGRQPHGMGYGGFRQIASKNPMRKCQVSVGLCSLEHTSPIHMQYYHQAAKTTHSSRHFI